MSAISVLTPHYVHPIGFDVQVNLNASTENVLNNVKKKYNQANITEAIAPTLEDMRNFHYAALLEYPEYAKGAAGAVLGLYFIRYSGYMDRDPSGMYGGKLVWIDGTASQDNFAPFFDQSFDPQVNKSNCYHFMTWIIDENDCS
ncbi:unnamed protein product [Gongylonema pulchrum]|uniref:Lectin_legB domain-containing protein n=1 Tax=Gongylonema pulchrum TaxID=637853 RepID=A0A183D0Q3_9BILA|nr:unnamed protein product [Gongylonema pulchrum]